MNVELPWTEVGPRLVFDAILIPYFLRLGSHPVHSLA